MNDLENKRLEAMRELREKLSETVKHIREARPSLEALAKEQSERERPWPYRHPFLMTILGAVVGVLACELLVLVLG